MICKFTIDIKADGSVKVIGLDPGKGIVVARGKFGGKDVLAVKLSGGSGWTGRFADRTYFSPEMHVLVGRYLKDKTKYGRTLFKIESTVIEWPIQRTQTVKSVNDKTHVPST